MRTAIAKLKSVSPYSQSRHYSDPPKKDKESHKDYEARTWMHRCHYDQNGMVFIPPMAFKNCLSDAARYLSIRIPGKKQQTYTKHFEAGVIVTEPLVLAVKWAEIKGEWLFVPSDGKRGSGSRVEKCFPIIHNWDGDVTFFILDDTITEDVFEKHLCEAGKFIGVGRFRPNRNGYYGRFDVLGIKWD